MPPPQIRRARGRPRLRLRVIGLVVLATLPLLVLAAIIAWRGEQSADARVASDRVALARAAALTVSSFVDAQIAAAQALVPTPDVSNPFTRPDLPGFLERALATHSDWEDVDLFDPSGWNIASGGRPPRTVNISDEPYFQHALTSDQPTVSHAMTSPRTGNQVVAVAIPVPFENGARGELVVTLSTTGLSKRLTGVEKNGDVELIVIDREGQVFASSGTAVLTGSVRQGPVVDAVLKGGTDSSRIDDGGVQVLAAYAPVTGVGWGILALQPASRAFGSVRRQLFGELALLALVAAITVALGWYFSRRLALAYERELAALARAEEAARQRDEFLTAASHDLKTPLTTIKSLAQLLLRRTARISVPDSAWLTEALTTIDAATSRMVAQIDELMDVARLQTGRPLHLDRRPVNLTELAAAVVAEHQPAAAGHHIRLETPAGAVIGNWDQARLERVLGNLLNNAIKYSPEGGEIAVTVDCERDDAGEWALLTVRDQGMGVPAADLAHIFEPFHRGGNAVGKVTGTGIGLSGVRRIVEEHGGTIAVESVEGDGATFRVRLPLAAEPSFVASQQ